MAEAQQDSDPRASPAGRIRQACQNCRRKKSKCPGERPDCSTCSRLQQKCIYKAVEPEGRKRKRSDEPTRDNTVAGEVSKRFGTIEQRLEELAASMKHATPALNNSHRPVTDVLCSSQDSSQDVENRKAYRDQSLPQHHSSPRPVQATNYGVEGLASDVVDDGIKTYFMCFHAQPYNLMCQQASLRLSHTLHPVVLNPMLALSIRCSSHPFWSDRSKLNNWIGALTEKSWKELVNLYSEGDTSLPYLQGLCLLAQVDFAGYLTNPSSKDDRSEEVVRCTWTLFMLDRTFSITRLVSPSLPYQEFRLRKPKWEGALSLNPALRNIDADIALKIDILPSDQDLSALLVGIYAMWDDVIRHHPFIMFIKLQHVIRKVPPSFLQKSYKSSLIHSRWIIRFLDEMDEAGMMLHDPFIGYLTAIAATIQLEHTLSKHSDIAAAARLSFASAVRYLKKLSKYWTSIQKLLAIVEELANRLRNRHTLYYSQDDYDGILPAVESERVGLAGADAELMWKVFDYASMSALSGKSPERSTFTTDQTELGRDERSIAHSERQTGMSNSLGSSQPSDRTSVPGNPHLAPIDLSNTQEHQAMIGQPNLSLFDQIPEDWAFTIDDWTLFGAPGSTYFHNEVS
ncbi:C6 transcription factor [Diplocarpon mali]|nr:C6 transcription factor [Diplocarpon mali]